MSIVKSSELIYTCCAGCETIYTAGGALDVGDREYCKRCVETGMRKDSDDDDDWVPLEVPGWWKRRGA